MKSSRQRAARVGTALALAAALVAPAATTSAVPDDPLSFEEDDPAVIYYARAHDVPIARAQEISNWMLRVVPLLTDLHQLTDVYADVRIVHGDLAGSDLPRGEVRVDILVTDASDAAFDVVLGRVSAIGLDGASITVEEVPRTLADLDREAERELQRFEPGSTEAIYDFRTGTVTYAPAAGEAPGFAWTNKCTDVTGGTLDGGRAFRITNPNATGCFQVNQCTTGFPMKFAGTYGIATAGHCLDDYGQNASGFVLNHTDRDTDLKYIQSYPSIYSSANAYWYRDPLDQTPHVNDGGYLRRIDASVGYPGRLWKYGADIWREITGYESTWAVTGQTVCVAASAATITGAGEYCGMVIGSRTDHAGETTNPSSRQWTEIDFSQGQYPDFNGPGGGGSGSPVYWGGRIYGLYSNADFCGGGQTLCNTARYYRVDSLYADMAAVSTDVHFICYPSVFCAMD